MNIALMKNLLLIALAVSTVGLAVFGVAQYRRATQLEADIVELQSANAQMQDSVAELQAAHDRAVKQAQELVQLSEQMGTALTQEKSAQMKASQAAAAAQAAALTNASPQNRGGALGKLIGSMMDDPEIKKMIREQQRGMMDTLYEPLIRQMGLSPEEAQQFKDLMADSAGRAAEKASSLMGGGASTNRAEVIAQLTADQQETENQLRTLLGEERFQQFQDYQLTAGERTQLNAFRQQNAGMENPITETQSDQLLQLIQDVKKQVASGGQAGVPPGNNAAGLEAMLSEEQTQRMLQTQESITQQVLERAGTVLQPDQLAAFGRFQTNQLNMMRMGINMSRRLLAPDEGR